MSSRIAAVLRRCFRFRLRTLLLAVLVISVGMGVYVNRVRRQQAAVAEILRVGGEADYDYQRLSGGYDANAKSSVPSWLLSRLGVDWFHSVAAVQVIYRDDAYQHRKNAPINDDFLDSLQQLPHLGRLQLLGGPASDEGLEKISRLRHLKELYLMDAIHVSDCGIAYLPALKKLETLTLTNSQITDESLRSISRLPRLKRLMVQGNEFTNDGLKHVSQMRGLERLGLCRVNGQRNSSISDDGLAHLRGLTQLQFLGLQGTAVTDAGLDHLAGLTELKEVWVSGSLVRDPARLQSALPNCVIDGAAGKP